MRLHLQFQLTNFIDVKIAVPKETKVKECRVALSPDVVKDLIKKGFAVTLEKGAGENSYYRDDIYTAAGATIESDRKALFSNADIILSVNAPSGEDIGQMKKDAVLISFMYAATHPELTEACAKAGISAFSMDAIPRISRAQKMDALSSQANLAGYKSVIIAADTLGKIFPLMMTAAGTIKPSKVVIMGAGVAGLQAIATAKRLGAIVEVSDIRPETKEQVQSLGGKFIEVDFGEKLESTGGYAKTLTPEQAKKQQELVAKHVAEADIVITTALIPGKKAPLLINEAMVKSMKNGSVIVDMAVEQGGNVSGSKVNENVVINGVKIIGESNLPSLLPLNASDLYAKNISAFLLHLASKDGFKWEMEEEITKGSLIVHQGTKKQG